MNAIARRFASFVCRICGHLRGVKVQDLAGVSLKNGVSTGYKAAMYECPRCKSRWTRRTKK